MDQSSRPLSDSLTLLRDAAAGLGSEDLHGVDGGSLLTDVADMRRLIDQVEGEWLRRAGASRATWTPTGWRGTTPSSAPGPGSPSRPPCTARASCAVTRTPSRLAVISAAIEPLSAPNPGADGVERRTPARRRLDAMVEIMRHHLDCQQAPDVRRPGAHLTVVTGAGTLAGAPGGSALDWGGVISGETTRRLACDATITPVTLSPQGQVLNVGRRSRSVTASSWAALFVRDRACAFPGCDTPTSRWDAHRVVHRADRGPTSLDNLVLLCRYHHQRVLHDDKHQDRWSVRIDEPTGRPVFDPPIWTGRRGVPLPPCGHPTGEPRPSGQRGVTSDAPLPR